MLVLDPDQSDDGLFRPLGYFELLRLLEAPCSAYVLSAVLLLGRRSVASLMLRDVKLSHGSFFEVLEFFYHGGHKF